MKFVLCVCLVFVDMKKNIFESLEFEWTNGDFFFERERKWRRILLRRKHTAQKIFLFFKKEERIWKSRMIVYTYFVDTFFFYFESFEFERTNGDFFFKGEEHNTRHEDRKLRE